jgi:hypothetical protein
MVPPRGSMPLTDSFLSAFRPDEAIEAVADADYADAMFVDGSAHNGANDRIQTRSVAASVDDADGANSLHGGPRQNYRNCSENLHLSDVTQRTSVVLVWKQFRD